MLRSVNVTSRRTSPRHRALGGLSRGAVMKLLFSAMISLLQLLSNDNHAPSGARASAFAYPTSDSSEHTEHPIWSTQHMQDIPTEEAPTDGSVQRVMKDVAQKSVIGEGDRHESETKFARGIKRPQIHQGTNQDAPSKKLPDQPTVEEKSDEPFLNDDVSSREGSARDITKTGPNLDRVWSALHLRISEKLKLSNFEQHLLQQQREQQRQGFWLQVQEHPANQLTGKLTGQDSQRQLLHMWSDQHLGLSPTPLVLRNRQQWLPRDSSAHQSLEHPQRSSTATGDRSSELNFSLQDHLYSANIPPAVFPSPDPEVATLVQAFRHKPAANDDAIRAAFSFGQLIEVLSMGSQNRLSLRFLSVLGTGGQGIVLLAENPSTGQKCAVKVPRLRANRRRGHRRDVRRLRLRSLKEMNVLGSVPLDIPPEQWSQDAHVVLPVDVIQPVQASIQAAGDKSLYGSLWVIFDAFSGDLSQIKQIHAASARAKLTLTKQMVMSVMRIHDTGFVHNDVKTSNFLLDSNGNVFLGDCSMIRPIGVQTPCSDGTSVYLPPENIRCRSWNPQAMAAQPQKDAWSLGVVLYRLWCYNSYPFRLARLHIDNEMHKISNVTADDLDITKCRPETPLTVLHMIRVLLEPRIDLRATPRLLYESHPVFTTPTREVLKEVLGDIVDSGVSGDP